MTPLNFKVTFFCTVLLSVFSCKGQETAVEKASWTFKYADNLEKALKNPLQATGVYILDYTDSVFPSEDIGKLINVEQIVIHGKGGRLRMKKKDAASAPLQIRIDTARLHLLTKLKYLSFNYFDFRNFPVELCDLKSLELLDVSICLVDSLPEKIGNLSNLKMLVARINNLTALPSSFARLDSLQFLDLGNNRMTKIPGELVMMKRLQKVGLANPDSPDSLAEKHWKWPYPVWINSIDFTTGFDALQALVMNKNIERVYLATRSKTTTQDITTRLKSAELTQKIRWQYIPPSKSKK